MVIKQLLSRLRASASAVAAAALENGLPQTGYLVAAATAEGAAVQRIMLLPIGQVVLRDGRGPFLLADREHAEAVVAASLARAGNSDLMIDYDHQSHFGVGEGKGGRAPAAGWIKNLHADDAGIWADVEWTSAAQSALAEREYRYISPLFYAGKDGRVALLRNAGLVNEPAIDALPAIAAAVQENDVGYTKIAAALGLPATATEDDILAALGAAAVGEKPKMVAAAAQFGLDAAADLDAIVAAATAAGRASPDPALFVPAADLASATTRLQELETARREQLIAAASEQGRLTPAMAEYARNHCADADALDAYIAASTVVVKPGEMLGGKPGGKVDLVTAADQYIAEQAAKGITVTAAAAVRHVQSTQNAGA
jgi:phage I-like protein